MNLVKEIGQARDVVFDEAALESVISVKNAVLTNGIDMKCLDSSVADALAK